MENIRYKEQVVTIAASEVGTTTTDVNLDASYDECVGVKFVNIDESDAPDYEVGLMSDGIRVLDSQVAAGLQVDRSVPVEDRYHQLSIPTGQQAQITTKLSAVPAAPVRHQVIFKLAKYPKC